MSQLNYDKNSIEHTKLILLKLVLMAYLFSFTGPPPPQGAVYPPQPGPYPQQPGPYPQQPGPYPQQAYAGYPQQQYGPPPGKNGGSIMTAPLVADIEYLT